MRGWLNRCAAMFAVCVLAGLYLAAGPGTPRAAAAAPSGWSPADLRAAYGLASVTSGVGMTVAVVTAYDDPDAQSDLTTYRTQYGLPACASGCFTKVNQTGGTTYPAPGWSAQDAETLDAISAVCPNCRIILVEATSSAITDLGTAENEAVTLGAAFIDNDWAIPEAEIGAAETSYDALYFNHPGVAITAPAGDSGYGVNYPAASPDVIAAGGTVLTQDPGTPRGWDETTWPSTGSGCSAYEAKPSWQTDTGCSGRTDNDTAAVATNLAYYDTPATGGWATGSGTEISAAIIAAALALTGTPTAGTNPASTLYAHPANLNDITTGTNGTCAVTYLCTAAAGYDGPTGLGTPSHALFPPAPSTGATPAIYDTTSGSWEVYATGTNGHLEEDYYVKSTSSWAPWHDIGGSITGTPAVINDPITGSFEIYAIGTDGTLQERYYNKSVGWGPWENLGGFIASSPAVILDAGTGNLDVYATGSSGNLEEDSYQHAGGGWTGWHNIGGSITGTPSVVNDTITGSIEIYATTPAGTLAEKYFNTSSGWGPWQDFGGSITGSPTAIMDTGTGNLDVYATGSGGNLVEDSYRHAGGGWTGWHNIGGSITGTPSVVNDTITGSIEIYATTPAGTLAEKYFNTSSGWGPWQDFGGSITGSPVAFNDTVTGHLDVYAVGTGGTLEQDYWGSGIGWSGWKNLGGSITAP